MYFLGLATDYDGTIAHHGFVNATTREALTRLKDTGRRLLLVTGREIGDLKRVFPELAIFDRVVAENGGVLYDPATDEETALAPAPSPAFVEHLMARGVEPISVGRTIVATWEPHQTAVLSAIGELELELQIIFNKGAVMVLPAGVNKATGLMAALAEVNISPHNIVAVGDAENDHAFLRACGCSAAVANALSTVRDEADVKLMQDHGEGVAELIYKIIDDDSRLVSRSRFGLLLGIDRAGRNVRLEPGRGVLIAGSSKSGKSRFARLLTERMLEQRFEFCVIDAEGDYPDLPHSVSVGDGSTPPSAEEALRLVEKTGINLVVNMLALGLYERQRFFATLLPRICDLRARTGRPHWLLIDEAHQVLAPLCVRTCSLPEILPTMICITVDPQALAPDVLRRIEVVLAFGESASDVMGGFAGGIVVAPPGQAPVLENDEILFWSRGGDEPPRAVKVEMPRHLHRRHTGKYAAGDVGEWQSFYFRGPNNTINLRAQNLSQFLELAERVEDAVWEHHLRAKDYSAWFREIIRDEDLAREAAEIEEDRGADARESRRRIARAVSRRYAMPIRAE